MENKICQIHQVEPNDKATRISFDHSSDELGDSNGYVFERERLQSRQREAVKELRETRKMLNMA